MPDENSARRTESIADSGKKPASPTARSATKSPAKAAKTPAKTPAKGPAKTAAAKRTSATKQATARQPAKKAAAKKPATRASRRPSAKAAPGPSQITDVGRQHPYRSLAERTERGLGWRTAAPIDGMDEFDPSSNRPSPLDILQAQDHSRLADLVPIRYGRMSASAFAFYRGSAAVMAYDLAQQARTPGRTQLCGDAHLSNFGFFGSPERDLVFDVNDFDETLPGPFEWDVKRLAASAILAARDRGFKKKEGRAAAVAAVEGYRQAVQRLAAANNMDVWYFKVDASLIEETIAAVAKADYGKKVVKQASNRLDTLFAKARSKTSLRAAEKLTEVVDGKRVFRHDPPLLARIGTNDALAHIESDVALATAVTSVFGQYKETLNNDRRRLLERFEFVDLAHKVVGVGSVGTRAFIVLLQGRDADDLLVLQVKQAQESVLEQYLGKSQFEHHGQRVVEGQRYMQAASDIFLGWATGPRAQFFVRQLHDMKGSVDLTRVVPMGLNIYAQLCGATLARAHARGGDIVAIASYLGEDDRFAQAVARFGEAYADQAERDFALLQQAIAAGQIPAQLGI